MDKSRCGILKRCVVKRLAQIPNVLLGLAEHINDYHGDVRDNQYTPMGA